MTASSHVELLESLRAARQDAHGGSLNGAGLDGAGLPAGPSLNRHQSAETGDQAITASASLPDSSRVVLTEDTLESLPVAAPCRPPDAATADLRDRGQRVDQPQPGRPSAPAAPPTANGWQVHPIGSAADANGLVHEEARYRTRPAVADPGSHRAFTPDPQAWLAGERQAPPVNGFPSMVGPAHQNAPMRNGGPAGAGRSPDQRSGEHEHVSEAQAGRRERVASPPPGADRFEQHAERPQYRADESAGRVEEFEVDEFEHEARHIDPLDPLDPLDPSVSADSVESGLPHRVPAPPDVPDVDLDEFADGAEEPSPADVDGGSLTRIASGLRTDARSAIPDDLDVEAVLAAVQQVEGVKEATLRSAPGEVQTLRLELADGADPGQVSRQVARLLKERMGIAAEPKAARSTTAAYRGAIPRPGAMPASTYGGATAGGPQPASGAAQDPYRAGPHQSARHAGDYQAGVRRPSHRPSPAGAYVPAREQVSRPATLSDSPAPHVAAGPPFAPDAAEPSAPVLLDRVKVSTFGAEALVEVRLAAVTGMFVGTATGPAVDAYLLRLAAQAAAGAIDSVMASSSRDIGPVRCFVDHAGVVAFGSCLVAVSVVLVSGEGWVEQLVGSALVSGDPRQAIVRATLTAVNRRLESLLT